MYISIAHHHFLSKHADYRAKMFAIMMPKRYNRKKHFRFSDSSILPTIRLEIGALAAWTPAKIKTITPYTAEKYERLFKQPSTEIMTVLPKRTFWEKVTILHREAYRPEKSVVPAR